jgi:hypothetical protein
MLFALAGLICYLYTSYLPYQENRKDLTRLNDQLLNRLPLMDMSVLVSVLIVVVPLLTMLELWNLYDFFQIEKLSMKYALCMIVKSITLYLTPLQVPKGYIALRDPVCSFLTSGVQYGTDLFFSGHTVLMYLCFVSSTHIVMRILTLVSIFAMGISLMMTRVHYTIDIFIAPFIGYSCHRLVEHICNFE